jgi:hypothetical protein
MINLTTVWPDGASDGCDVRDVDELFTILRRNITEMQAEFPAARIEVTVKGASE